MKITTTLFALTGLLALALVTPAFAADKAKEVTITGDGKCAKCVLHEGDKCRNAIQVDENGKTVTYYLADNKLSKEFHENICKESKKVTATGKVKEKDGKMVLTASKLELVK
jgi:hypothetical protein